MQLTLREIFEKYKLLQISKVAAHFGYSREWLSSLVQDRMQIKPHKKQKHLRMIQDYLREVGSELSQVEIIEPKKK